MLKMMESRIRCHITGRPREFRGNAWRSFCRDLLHIFSHRVLPPQPSPQVFTLIKSSGHFWNMEKGSLSRGNQYSTLLMNNNFQTVCCKESERHVEKVDLPSYSPPSQSLSDKQSGNLQQQKSSNSSRAGSSWRREASTSGKLPTICDFLDRRWLLSSKIIIINYDYQATSHKVPQDGLALEDLCRQEGEVQDQPVTAINVTYI